MSEYGSGSTLTVGPRKEYEREGEREERGERGDGRDDFIVISH
jgi:hypothetical protein